MTEGVYYVAPYHPKESRMAGVGRPAIWTGLWGAFAVIVLALVGLLIACACAVFVALGFAEYVSEGVTRWRVRWVRHDDIEEAR